MILLPWKLIIVNTEIPVLKVTIINNDIFIIRLKLKVLCVICRNHFAVRLPHVMFNRQHSTNMIPKPISIPK